VRADSAAHPEAVLVLSTLGAFERRLLRGRRGKVVTTASPEPVPTNRATVVHAEPFEGPEQAERWLAGVRGDVAARDSELAAAVSVLNRALHAYRVSRGDPTVRDVAIEQALVVRIGFGTGDEIVDGHYGEAWELPRGTSSARRSMEAPEERFAAVIGGREPVLACEELVLRVRLDLDAGRHREAALQARVALEALLAELPTIPGQRRGPLEADRDAVGRAANAALRGDLADELRDALSASAVRMESALRARRLSSAS
jgi:hypothetical protein